MEEKRFSLEELREVYPDKWVILDDCEWYNKSTVKSGVLIGVCDDEDISRIRMKNRHDGKQFIYRRTTEGFSAPYVHAVNYEVTT